MDYSVLCMHCKYSFIWFKPLFNVIWIICGFVTCSWVIWASISVWIWQAKHVNLDNLCSLSISCIKCLITFLLLFQDSDKNEFFLAWSQLVQPHTSHLWIWSLSVLNWLVWSIQTPGTGALFESLIIRCDFRSSACLFPSYFCTFITATFSDPFVLARFHPRKWICIEEIKKWWTMKKSTN